MPDPGKSVLPKFRSATFVQADPFQVLHLAGLGELALAPPIDNAAVLLAPAAPGLNIATGKSATSVQLVPFHDSVSSLTAAPGFSPENARADVPLPVPDN